MKKTHTLVAGVVAGAALVLAASSYAQPFGGMGRGFCPSLGMGPGYTATGGFDRSALVESRLGALKTQLKISAAQEAAWQTYTDQVKQQATGMQALYAQMHQNVATAPERMALQTTAMQQRSASMAAMSNAFSALYAVLTPEQKTIADQNFGMMGRRGMPFGRRAG